jgi:hypothetical protein
MSPYVESLVLFVRLLGNDTAPNVQIPLEVTFKNIGPKAVRLLDTFTPRHALFFFRVQLTRADGTLVPMRGGGKVDLDPSTIRYRELAPAASFAAVLDLVVFAGKLADIPPGEYSVTVTYSNQYGNDCFKGSVTSPTVKIVVPRRDDS